MQTRLISADEDAKKNKIDSRLSLDATALPSVGEVDDETDYEPDNQTEPCIEGQAQHQRHRCDYSEYRNERDHRDPEGSRQIGAHFSQRQDPGTDDRKRKQRADAHKLPQHP